MLSLKRKWLLFLLIITALVPIPNHPCRAASSAAELLSKWGITIDILPSSSLYPLKIYWEDIRLILSPPNSDKRALLLLSFCNRRLEEIYSISDSTLLTDNIQLFKSLRRYQDHYNYFNAITSSLEVGSQEITDLLDRHQKQKEQLKEFLEKRKHLLGNFWFYEITSSLFTENELQFASQGNSPTATLGTPNDIGLELYPLED